MALFSRRSRGSTLVMNLLALAVFAMLGVVVYRSIKSQVREVVYQERLAQSFYIAEAGLEDALMNVYYNSSWRAGFYQKPLAGGYYTVTLSTDSPPVVTSKGYSQSIAMFGRAFTTVSATAQVTYSTTTAVYAVMANSSVQVNGPARIDAYYVNQNVDPVSFVFGAGLWSNGAAAVTAGSQVNGNLYYMTTASVAPGAVIGSVIQSSATQTLANHTCGACKNRNNNATITGASSCYSSSTMDLTVNPGANCNLKTGTFYFRNITVSGNLNVDTSSGAVTIYYTGPLTVNSGGSVNNNTRVPSLLYFYGDATGNSHTITSTSPVHAYLEEPTGTWNVHATLYGHIWGKYATVYGDGSIHADIGGANPNMAAHVGWKKPTWARGPKKK